MDPRRAKAIECEKLDKACWVSDKGMEMKFTSEGHMLRYEELDDSEKLVVVLEKKPLAQRNERGHKSTSDI